MENVYETKTFQRKLNQVIVEEVLLWVASGGTLRSYCRQEGKPAYTTIYNWMNRKDNRNLKTS